MEKDEGTGSGVFLKSGYYTGKLLHAADFIRDQRYVSSKLDFMNRKFHGWGIIEGLTVQAARDGGLWLTRGSAIDPWGRILLVQKDRQIMPEDIEGLSPETVGSFILGIRYAESTVETERDYLEPGGRNRPSVIAETCSFGAYRREELRKLQREALWHEEFFTEERILYESGPVMLALQAPKAVPTDSIFRIRMEVRAARESNVSIGWHGMAKLQGAVFIQSGTPFLAFEEERAVCLGLLRREWDICTEENRRLPVILELSDLRIVTENGETVEIPTCQISVDTAVSYGQAVKDCLGRLGEPERGEGWVPLACLRLEQAEGKDGGKYVFSLPGEEVIRPMAACPWEEELLRSISEKHGILDIRWRGLLKQLWKTAFPPPGPPPVMPGVLPPGPSPAGPGMLPPGMPPMPPELLTEEHFWELLEADRESCIHRGVAVIQIPKRYRKGQVLYSEEISHGFPGEEVFLRCSRVWEERSYAYWERDRKRYKVIHGPEELFPDVCEGRKIDKEAVLQNVEEGTFRIAVTLGKGKRRSRNREVAISWTAVRGI